MHFSQASVITGTEKDVLMNDSEMRRRELLRQTRKLYDDRRDIPAVHPRYGRIYHSLYDSEEEEQILVWEQFLHKARDWDSVLCLLRLHGSEQGERGGGGQHCDRAPD